MPELSDLQPPSTQLADQIGVAPLALTPAQQLFFYDPDRWEEFVREWASALTPAYHQVKRIGGANDMGADVAGFCGAAGFGGEWDCFQCKHYADALAWSDCLPELIKVFRHATAGDYTLPRRYAFLAPRGLSASMNRLISHPAKLRKKFLDDAPGKLEALGIHPDVREAILALAASDDFARFASVELHEVLDTHRSTPYFAFRFGTPLPPRDLSDEMPEEPEMREAGYIDQLIDVYNERFGASFDGEALRSDARTSQHFRRQRVRFFEAESLRGYARDSVPPGTFSRFQEAILSGIQDEVDADHPNGWSRLHGALSVAGRLNLSSHALIAVVEQDDLKGVCHQLANDDRVRWMVP